MLDPRIVATSVRRFVVADGDPLAEGDETGAAAWRSVCTAWEWGHGTQAVIPIAYGADHRGA